MQLERIKPDAVVFSLLIEAYVVLGYEKKALQSYYEMLALGIYPSTKVLTGVLTACEKSKNVGKAMELLEECRKRGVYPDQTALLSLLSMHIGVDFKMAWHFYEQAQHGRIPAWMLHNLFVYAYQNDQTMKVDHLINMNTAFQTKEFRLAFELYWRWEYMAGIKSSVERHKELMDEGCLLKALELGSSKGDFAFATNVYEIILRRFSQPSVYTFNAMLFLCAKTKHQKQFLDVLHDMDLAGYRANSTSSSMFATGCSTTADIDQAYSHLEKRHVNGAAVSIDAINALVYACSRAGEHERAKTIFKELKKFGAVADINTCNAVLCGFTVSKDILAALSFIEQFKQQGDLSHATQVLGMVQSDRLAPTHSTYSQLAQICVDNGEFTQANNILVAMRQLGMTPDARVVKSVRRAM